MDQRKVWIQILAAFAVSGLAVPLVHADILVGAPNSIGSYYGMCCSGGAASAAAEFTLSTSQFVSTIDVSLWGGTSSDTIFNFSLQNSLTSPTTVYASA